MALRPDLRRALWPEGSTYGGGGFFEDNRTLILNYHCALKELNDGVGIPASFVVSHLGEYRQQHHAGETTAASQGWALASKGAEGAPTSERGGSAAREARRRPARPGVRERARPGRGAAMAVTRLVTAMGYGERNARSGQRWVAEVPDATSRPVW